MTCREAIRDVFEGESGVLATDQVVQRLDQKHPERPWKHGTITAHLIGLSVNHPSSRHYPNLRQHALLFTLGGGRYRRWVPEQDGVWRVTATGVELTEDGEGTELVELVDETEALAADTSLSLERDLEKALVANLQQLEPGLRLYSAEGLSGQQLDTGVVGRLDLLAVDKNGDFVVIELKAGEAGDKVCGQILRYMGWVKREIARDKPVRGIIVANEFSESLKYAVQMVPGVGLRKYEVRFAFTDVQ